MFIDRDTSDNFDQPPVDGSGQFHSNEEPIKMTLTASRKAVERMILLLHDRNIIGGSEWSRPIAIKNSTEVISVASRMIQID